MGTNPSKQKTGKKILGIINALRKDEALGVTELSDRLNIAKSTAHYHLDTLHEEGYVVKDDSKYRLSLQFLRIGELTRSRVPIFETATEEVEKLAGRTNELAILAVEEQGMGVYLYKAAGENAIDIDAPIGRFAHLHNRAYGKAILSQLKEERVKSILDEHGLPETSAQTITDRDDLFNELEQIRTQGFAINREESIEGIHGIAVPILDNDGSILGGISIAGPSERLSVEKMTDDYADLLSRSQNIIELTVQHPEFQ
ncbi:IclR family transcriptional regulator [Saliphagus infecundisoli]|uniref:IclR family transcriptional regulator n=1 Tax=Saliphagus infecundisoli TaxID=1849069 RepID=A0ABD5QAC1_9EURY|nr:IclR family transcriptional regulator [Saliphagus infecundisoli]